MPREVSDEEYRFLQDRRQVADFVESIYNDPQLGAEARALIKKKYPQVQIPEHDLRNEFEQKLSEERKAREETEKKRVDDESKKAWQQTREKVQKEYGFTPEGLEDLEKFMVEKNIGDYEIAAEYRASKNPKQSDANHSDGRWHHQKQDGFAEIAKDPEGWAENEILGALRRDQERARGR